MSIYISALWTLSVTWAVLATISTIIIIKLVRDADIVVQLSRFEQGAWAPLEGVLCKTPIIVTADTGTGEDVKRINAGYLVDFDNNEQLATTIIDILGDYQVAQDLTNKARDHIIQKLSMNARIGEYTQLYL